MSKNRFAQPLYGKIIYIYETDLKKEDLSTIFDPSTFWIDVTDVECEVGYLVDFKEGVGLVLTPPTNTNYTLEEEKHRKIELLKAERDAREVAPVEYAGILYDYDSKSRDRLDSAERGFENGERSSEVWTTADNAVANLDTETYKGIDKAARDRSRQLHYQYNKLKAYVNNLEDIEKVRAVEFDDEV